MCLTIEQRKISRLIADKKKAKKYHKDKINEIDMQISILYYKKNEASLNKKYREMNK